MTTQVKVPASLVSITLKQDSDGAVVTFTPANRIIEVEDDATANMLVRGDFSFADADRVSERSGDE